MKAFFDSVNSVFGKLSQSQVDGFDSLLKATEKVSTRHRAYILATTWHETAKTMQPIREYGRGKGKKYGVPDPTTGEVYYGRGYVQLTWKDNYAKAEKRLKELGLIDKKVSLVKQPDLVMQPTISAHILITGMLEGWFTGKKLADYDSYESMRRVVNGTDRAKLIAEYAGAFEDAINKTKDDPVKLPIPDVEPIEKPTAPVKGTEKSIAAVIIGAILAAFAAFAAWMIGGD